MSTLAIVIFGIGCACADAGIANAIWLRVFRRSVSWWHAHCERCERENKGHIDNLVGLFERQRQLTERYREYLDGKIVIDDPSVPRRRDRGQA